MVSTEPIVAYAHQYDTQLSGATMLMPVETYGYTYYSINYTQPYTPGDPGKCWFFVVAAEDNTTLEITPADTTETGRLPHAPFTVNLNKGEIYNVFGKISDEISKDLTGSKIVSVSGADGKCHPVAVFSGNSRFIVCKGDGGEIAQQQLFPASAWGTRYLSYHSFNTVSNPLTTPFLNFYRVAVSDPAAVVKRNGIVLTGLQRNFYYEFQSVAGDYIESDLPVMVCQYTPSQNQCTGTSQSPQGDPEMFFLSPVEQGIKKATIYNTRNSNITVGYLTVIIPNEGLSSLRIDGAKVPSSITGVHPANPAYSLVAKRLLGSAAQHTIESDLAFTAMLYGTGLWESYGYIAGTLVNNLNSIGEIHNIYNATGTTNTFSCPNSPVQFTIKIAYKATSLQWLLSQVNSLSPAKDTLISNPVPMDSQMVNGRRYYSYTLNSEYRFTDTGTFYIPVIYTSPNIDNCSKLESTTITVLVKPGPAADFSFSYPGCSKDTALFTATPTAGDYNIDRYNWYYEDGSIDATKNSKKVFLPGNHPVTFRVISDNGCLDDTVKTVTTFLPPVAKFSHDRDVCMGDSIHFTDSSSVATGNITRWSWDFADGRNNIFSTAAPFYHLFSDTGTYRLSLIVTSGQGCESDSFYLPVSVHNKPRAVFSVSGSPCVDSSFTFIPAVFNYGNTIESSFWNFGDGKNLAEVGIDTVSHSYHTALNNIRVQYSVSGGPGCVSDTAALFIPAINMNPVAKFGFNAGSFCPEKDIIFIDSSGPRVQSWLWNFGDGLTVVTPLVSHSFHISGDHAVQLVVKDSSGCGSAPFVLPVTIYAKPDIDAGPSILKPASANIMLNASVSNSSLYQYQWKPSNFLSNTNTLNPFTSTSADIIYTVSAFGGPGSCEASDTVSVVILKELFIPNAFTPNGDGLNDRWNLPTINGNPNAMVTIINRWGQKIYESRGYQHPWDGTLKGVEQPAGAYFYIIQPNFNDSKKLTGSVILLR